MEALLNNRVWGEPSLCFLLRVENEDIHDTEEFPKGIWGVVPSVEPGIIVSRGVRCNQPLEDIVEGLEVLLLCLGAESAPEISSELGWVDLESMEPLKGCSPGG